jgi:hypothetical protein
MNISSMVPLTSQGGHSAQVDISLLINGLVFSVAQMGPDFVLLNDPVDHPPTSASVLMRVDQSEQRWNVRLPSGISADKKRVEIAASA